MGNEGIGGRVRAAVGGARPHGDVADAIGMTKDAFSRSINGKRAFTSMELAGIADLVGADIHWLITGDHDPLRRRVVARHQFDYETGERSVPGREEDEEVLERVELAYRQAFPNAENPTGTLPATAPAVRNALGTNFVDDFAERVESRLSVDVVRVPGLTTDYSIVIGGRDVVVLASTGNWLRSNWSLAHELGHLVLAHHTHDDDIAAVEGEANAFAAELLLPREAVRAVDWNGQNEASVALMLWQWGVSGEALAKRLGSLGIVPPSDVESILRQTTQHVLRRGLVIETGPSGGIDDLTERMKNASARRFPDALLEAHVARIESGAIAAGTLAWMLDMPEQDLVVDIPDPPRTNVEALAGLLGH